MPRLQYVPLKPLSDQCRFVNSFIFVSSSIASYEQEMRKSLSTFQIETKTLSNSYLIRHCKSAIVIFAWRFT